MQTIKNYIYLSTVFLLFSCSRERAPEAQGMVYVPSGEFIMGSKDVDTDGLGREFGLRRGQLYEDEKPMRRIFLKGFYINKHEVTNNQYRAFIAVTGYKPPQIWIGGIYPPDQAEHPVNHITWFDAQAYCKWTAKRLPTEEEWEKAAKGPNGNRYPWGNEYDEKKANLTTGGTTPVGSYESDKSYYGVYDMGGNVMEWIDAWYEPYPGNKMENKDFGKKYRIVRGGTVSTVGHYALSKIFSRSAYRYYYDPYGVGEDIGFRCAAD